MNKTNMYTKSFTDEEMSVCRLDYSLLIRSAEMGQIFGVSVQKTDAFSVVEEETVDGLFETRDEAERFLSVLAEGLALPIELTALCDDYISKRESE
ncbi:MAG: hypothetical protein IJN89_08425 [Anaerotignum sp.]|nr:hypothetical protein [Anaerotignum sp.]